MSRQYLRRADGLIVLYDVTREASFLGVRKWIQMATDGAGIPAINAKRAADSPAIAIVGEEEEEDRGDRRR